MRRLGVDQIKAAQSSLKRLNAFISVAASRDATSNVQGPLSGLHIAIKDNICTKELPTTCGSRLLAGYASPFDATVVEKLMAAGAVVAGKTNLDEFGMGSHSLYSHSGSVKNINGTRSVGGSSGGSAVAVATRQCDAALGTDTGGSVRLPAAYNGIYGFKPSYGRLSRWGVVAYANSLDTVGILASDMTTLKAVYKSLDGYDERDPTSLRESTRSKLANLTRDKRSSKVKLKFGVPEQYRLEEMSSTVRQAWGKTLDYLLEKGHSIHSISLPMTEQALAAYYIIAPAEASSNLAKYDGVRYGNASKGRSNGQLYAATREQGFGEEVKRRILLGTYSLSADAIDNHFIQAQKIRRLVQGDFNSVFNLPNALLDVDPSTDARRSAEGKIDAIICPTSIDVPPLLSEVRGQSPLEAYAGDALTIPASLAGLPALNAPVGIDGMPSSYDGPDTVGIQVITQYGDDDAALAIGEELRSLGSSTMEE